jgi:hypothetical protein
MSDLPRLALSIRQPWAHCILHLGKPVENRSWPTNVRGSICIHASKNMTLSECRDGLETYRYSGAGFDRLRAFPERSELSLGGIVGVVDIVDCVTDHPSAWFFGPYGFVLENPRPAPFVEVSGALGFFDWRKRLKD